MEILYPATFPVGCVLFKTQKVYKPFAGINSGEERKENVMANKTVINIDFL